MNSYIQWVLRREHQGCTAPIPVPTPIHTGTIADLQGLPRGEQKAVFLCSACGLATLYSDADLPDQVLGTPDPYLQKVLDLVYIEAECVDSNCESRTKIHGIRDFARANFATTIPMNEWRFDDSARCENSHPVRLRLRLGQALPYYRARCRSRGRGNRARLGASHATPPFWQQHGI
jgi:hypothetical protein